MKPEFFRDEDLQDLERANPGRNVMLVFAGLWGHCDKNGSFEWKPRTLKLDILPFLDFDMTETLSILWSEGFIKKYADGGKDYGYIPKFEDHQRIGGKEAQEPGKHPKPTDASLVLPGEATGKQQGLQEGKGREGNRKGTEVAPGKPDAAPTTPVWESYANAFETRNGVRPLRNAKANALLANFLKQVPADEAPGIAAHYVTNNLPTYVVGKHPLELLLRDAQKLRAEWVTGDQANAHAVRQNERTAANPFARMANQLEAIGNGK